jgi:hypothetical protein
MAKQKKQARKPRLFKEIHLVEGLLPKRPDLPEIASGTIESKFKVGESQAKLFREMYDKGFDAGKEAMRQKLNKFLSDNL